MFEELGKKSEPQMRFEPTTLRDLVGCSNGPLSYYRLYARVVEEVGSVGLLRDVFSLFLFVPFVRHDYQRKERVAVGRILVKGCLTCQYLSVLLEIYECMTISNDVNRVSVETVGRIKRAFLCLYTYRKCDSD